MKIKDGMTYENFVKEFKYEGILCIITDISMNKYLKTFEKLDDLPKNLVFIEEKNNEYYFDSQEENKKYCFFNQTGKKVYDLVSSKHENIFLRKKIIIINDIPSKDVVVLPKHKHNKTIEQSHSQ
jgi:hypothetical protein